MYAKYLKRMFDFILSFVALVVLSPVLLVLTVVGAIVMKGNPFFTQMRPGKDEKRLTKYGKILRSTSLDELPELWNILKGDMAIVGPRPLLVEYLPLCNEEQKRRHDVRPGLTGYAQVHGRNTLTWAEKFKMDTTYVKGITLLGDLKIIFDTVFVVLKKEGISSETSATMEFFTGTN